MTQNDYKQILKFFGDEASVICCLKKKIGEDLFLQVLDEVRPQHRYTNVLADVSQRCNLYFMRKSPKSKPNCILVKLDFFPPQIPSRALILLSKEDVVKMMNKKCDAEWIRDVPVKEKKPSVKKLKEMEYDQFLNTEYWKKVRQAKLRACGHKCQLCGSKRNLHIHHNSYEHHGEEDKHLEDLIVLCSDCHALFHQKLKVIK